MTEANFTAPARNVGITWKVILLLWLALMAVVCLRASVPTPVLTPVTPDPVPSGTVNMTIKGSGFQSGVMLYQTHTGQSRIQHSPTPWAANKCRLPGAERRVERGAGEL
jgi:hypothetical protein